MANDALMRLRKGSRYIDLSFPERQALIDESIPLLVGPTQRESVFLDRFLSKMPGLQSVSFLCSLGHTLLGRVIEKRILDVGPLAVRYLAMEIRRSPKRAETRLALLRPEVAARVSKALADFIADSDE